MNKKTKNIIEEFFNALNKAWDKEPELLISLGITDEIFKNLEDLAKGFNLTNIEKKQRLLNHYDFDEILEILGYFDGSNEDVCNNYFNKLELQDKQKFISEILDIAIINGNFEEVILTNKRHAL